MRAAGEIGVHAKQLARSLETRVYIRARHLAPSDLRTPRVREDHPASLHKAGDRDSPRIIDGEGSRVDRGRCRPSAGEQIVEVGQYPLA